MMAPVHRVVADEVAFAVRHVADVALEANLAPPKTGSRLARFFWGVALPFGITRAALREPGVRAAWVRWSTQQLVVLVPVTLVFGFLSNDVREKLQEGALAGVIEAVVSLYASATIAEWIIIAFARDYHEVLSAYASHVVGVPAERIDAPPRVHVSIPWLWLKLKRRIRAAWLVLVGLPPLAILFAIPAAGEHLNYVASLAWSAYWLGVLALGNSFLAWQTVPTEAPWYVRAFMFLGKLPLIGFAFRLYARFLAKATETVAAPCSAFERDPFVAMGLALARAVGLVPGLYLFYRPAFAAAATYALVEPRAANDALARPTR